MLKGAETPETCDDLVALTIIRLSEREEKMSSQGREDERARSEESGHFY